MASNFFGQLFRITTFGESHGPGVGVVIDGCPAGLSISVEDIHLELRKRRPGHNPHTSPRKEEDDVEIFSGVFEGVTTGAPIALLIRNKDADTTQYAQIKDLYRPGHANFAYLAKYGVFDYRGGGRASARETASRVAAGAVAKKLLAHYEVECVAYLAQVGDIYVPEPSQSLDALRIDRDQDIHFCPDRSTSGMIGEKIEELLAAGDSVGGVVHCLAKLPPGWGDPIYGKLDALLASAMLSLPATKGFEIGSGFLAAHMAGSVHNDPFILNKEGRVVNQTNWAGGVLAGISTGEMLSIRVAFKPTSSIKKTQHTVTLEGEEVQFAIPQAGRHDPCVAIRAVAVVEAMSALVLADVCLMQRAARL